MTYWGTLEMLFHQVWMPLFPSWLLLWSPSLWRTLQKFSGALASTRGGLEIVFNQQLTRLGYSSLTASLPQAQRWRSVVFRWPIYSTIKPNSDKGYGRNQTTAETSPWSSLKFLACEHTRNSSTERLEIAGVGMKLSLWRRLRKSAINFIIQQIFWSSLNSGFIWS